MSSLLSQDKDKHKILTFEKLEAVHITEPLVEKNKTDSFAVVTALLVMGLKM